VQSELIPSAQTLRKKQINVAFGEPAFGTLILVGPTHSK